MSRRHDVQDATGRVEVIPGRGVLQAYGTGAPTNSVAGYAPGCLYHRVDGGNLTALYVNEGTATSSTWVTLTNYLAGGAAFTSRVTTTDGIASGTARVVGGRAASAAGTAVHDSATEAVSTTYTIPASTLIAGSVLMVSGKGTATTTVGTDTLQFKLRFGTTSLSGTALITSTATDVADGDQFQFTYLLYCTAAAGAAVAMFGHGWYSEPAGTALKIGNLASTNFATNGALIVEGTLKWSTANANTGQVDWMQVLIF